MEHLGEDPAGVIVRPIEEVSDGYGVVFISVGHEILPGKACVVRASLGRKQTDQAQNRSVNPQSLLHLSAIAEGSTRSRFELLKWILHAQILLSKPVSVEFQIAGVALYLGKDPWQSSGILH